MSKEKFLFFKSYNVELEKTRFIEWLGSISLRASDKPLEKRLLTLIENGKLSNENSREILCKKMLPEILELLLSDTGLLLMKKEYITAWDMGVYFSRYSKSASLVISERAYELFEKGLVEMADLYRYNRDAAQLDLFLKEKEKKNEMKSAQLARIYNRGVENEGKYTQAQYEDVDFSKHFEDLNFTCSLL